MHNAMPPGACNCDEGLSPSVKIFAQLRHATSPNEVACRARPRSSIYPPLERHAAEPLGLDGWWNAHIPHAIMRNPLGHRAFFTTTCALAWLWPRFDNKSRRSQRLSMVADIQYPEQGGKRLGILFCIQAHKGELQLLGRDSDRDGKENVKNEKEEQEEQRLGMR